MKKSGFTLAELVITLSIIGVAAALVAPALGNLVPDKNKVRVLKYNAKIQNGIDDLFNTEYNGSFGYKPPYTKTDGTLSCEGLGCIEGFDAQNFVDRYLAEPGTSGNMSGSKTQGYTITFTVRDNKPAKQFTAGDTKNINTFVFKIDKYGAVSGGDPLTKAYLMNPLNMNDRKADYEAAKKLK